MQQYEYDIRKIDNQIIKLVDAEPHMGLSQPQICQQSSQIKQIRRFYGYSSKAVLNSSNISFGITRKTLKSKYRTEVAIRCQEFTFSRSLGDWTRNI